jgi:hypothetical protein
MNLAAQDVYEPGVFEKQLRRLFTPGDAELLLDVPHVVSATLTHSTPHENKILHRLERQGRARSPLRAANGKGRTLV